ncbi:immunoglobulin I-set domain protein, partial [Ancylostoma duodenale]
MDRRPIDDAAGPRGSVTRELRVDTDGEWPGMPSPRRVATAPSSPSTAFQTDREAIFRSGNKTTVAETHLMRSSGSQSESFTEEHWSSEITSFVTAAPPKFLQNGGYKQIRNTKHAGARSSKVIKAYRVLSSDTPTLVVEVVSDPPAIFEWFCNDRPVQQDRRRFQARHGLNITTLTVHQPEQGVYKCTARNPAGISTSYGYITVNFEHQKDEWTIVERSMAKEEGQSTITIHRAPRFINQVPNLTIQPGSLAVIDVEVDADPPARFSWFVNGVEYRESCKDVEIYCPSPNRCVAKFSLPVCGEYKAVASNVHGSAMSSGYIEIYRAKPTRTMRPPVAPGEHLARNIMTASHHPGTTAPTGEKMITTHEVVNVYEINYTQRSSSVPRGVRHLESHVEVPHTSQRRISLEQHRSEHGSTDVKLPERLPRSLFKTRSEGAARYLPHAPKFVTTLPPQVAINPNENLVLSVNVDAIPTAEFRWDVNGFEVKPSKKPPVKLGKYSVTAFNDQGRETLLTRVVHVVTETTEQVKITKTATETNQIQPDIVESAVTMTSANEADWEVVDGVDSDPSTTSIKTVRRKEQTTTTAPKVEKVELSVPIVTNVKIQQIQKEEPNVAVKIKEVRDIVTQQTQQETVVTRKYFKKTKPVQENIPKRPVLLSEPSQNVHLSAGEKLVLESRVDSYPPATFRWYVNNFEAKNGQYITIVQPEENVSVATFQKPTPGLYKVVASNPHGEVTAVTKVTTEHVVEELHEHTTVTTTTKPTMYSLSKKPVVTVRDDLPKPPQQPIKFKAAVDAVPEATFMWLLNNFELKKNQNITINRIAENVSELSLQKVQPGKYDVVAKNHMGQDSCSCKVIVEYEQPAQPPPPPPRFTRTLCEETYFQEDEETILEVAASGSPPFSFKWSADGTELKSSKDTQITVDGNRSTLILPKGYAKPGTVIAVEVSDRYGKNRSQTIMKEVIKEESKTTITIEKKPVDVVVKEETVKKEEVKEEQVKRERVRRPSQPASEAPRFVRELENINIYEGDTLSATIRLCDEGAASNFGWFANGLLLIPSQQVRIRSTTHQSTLTIENIGEMSNVELCVMARNEFGTASSAATLNVGRRPDESFEMVPPDLPEECAPKIVEPLHSASFIDGQPMVLRCRIEAIPSAAIVWSKDDVNVEEWVINKDVVTQILPGGICELLNPEVYPEDSGLYKCTATNPHGTAETAAYINIEGVTYRKDREEASASETVSGVADEPTVVVMPPKFVEQLNAETDGAYELNYVRLLCRIRSAICTDVERYSDEGVAYACDWSRFPPPPVSRTTSRTPTTQTYTTRSDRAVLESDIAVFSSAPTTISWWKDGVELFPSKKYEFHRFSDGALILTVYEPQPSDNGTYTCKAESEHGVSSSSCEVTVPTRTTVTETVTETSTTEETSTVAESSTLQVIETSKEDYVATTEITKHEEEYKLLVKVADSVASTLVANVFVDAVREAVKRIMEEESEEEEIVVVDAPRFETSIERYVVQENETVTISTVVTGTPTPFIEWYFKDQKLHVTEQISMGYENKVATLILKNVTKAQEGTYYCHATNVHGTTVLPSEVKVVPEKASDTIRLTLAKYDKREESEHLVTNIFAHRKEEEFEQVMKMHVPEKASESTRLQATPRKPVETVKPPTEEAVPVPIQRVEESPVPPPRKHPPKEREEVPVVVETPVAAPSKEEEEQKTHLMYSKFAETFASNVMSQAQTDFLTSETTIKLKTTPVTADQSPEVERVALQVEGEADKLSRQHTRDMEIKVGEVEEQVEAATYMAVTQPKGNIVVNSTISLKEQINEEATTIDVRRPFTQFNHAVTVVEPEVVQLGLRLPAPSVPTMKFIDLETILQRPGTSSSANTLITSPSKGSANAEHRIVVLEGASQNFQNAMTLSLKKVQRLATESAEPSSFAQVEILRPNEANEAVVKIVDAEKIIPDLLRVAAAASKLKLENVTVSLVKQPDTAHHELVIEYESHVEDAADFNLSQIVYDHPQEERKEEVWSRRSRFSEVDENVVAVFVEVDANCPDQSVEILATVNAPLEEKIDSKRPFSPDVAEVSVSEITESSLATGQQQPRFFRELKDCSTVVGKTVQFKCIVSGLPTPEVKWYVDGDVIQQSREYDIVYEDGVCILRINEALAEDEGEYSCEATNSVGRAETKCFLRVLDDNRPQQQRFIEHAPSVVELVELVDDAPDSFDSFEFEEHKANSLFPSNEGSLKRSSVTYNSEFDLSKIVNYNENMEETNAFYKYFDTAQTSVRIWEIEQYERVVASVHAPIVEDMAISPNFSKPPLTDSVSCEIPSFPLEKEHFDTSAPLTPKKPSDLFDDLKELLPYIDNTAHVPSEKELINELREPREPDLPEKMSYKGHEIAVSVSEVEKEEIILNENGDIEISKKTCLETSFEFDTELDIAQSIKKIYKALPEPLPEGELMSEILSHPLEGENVLEVLEGDTVARAESPRDTELDPERARAQSVRPKPRLLADVRKSASEGINSKAFDPQFISKMKEIERIARQVDAELGQISAPPPTTALTEDAKEIEEAIFKISDQLLLAQPITEAQAEANEELLRTTLADMILNPTRTAEEEMELMRRPIRLLRRKLSDFENSLMEDVEVMTINEDARSASPTGISGMGESSTTPTRSTIKTRVPSAEYLRVTPLTSNIKDQLSCLEEMIVHLSNENMDAAMKPETSSAVVKGGNQKKRELHDLLVQINNEMNTIKSYCKTKLSKKGTDAVVGVLQRVKTHVSSIVNVVSLSKKKHSHAIEKSATNTTVDYEFVQPSASEKVDALMFYKKSSLESSVAQ